VTRSVGTTVVGFTATKNDPPRVVWSSGAGCSSA
jgi:hypothetical protein